MRKDCALGIGVLLTVFALAEPALGQPPPPPPPRHKVGEELLEMYLSPSNVRFEIDYDQQRHPGSGTVMQAFGVYRLDFSDGTHEMEVRHISGQVIWHSSNEDIYPILGGEYGNLDETGLLITWQYNDGYTGTTTITIIHPDCDPATGAITAYDGRAGK